MYMDGVGFLTTSSYRPPMSGEMSQASGTESAANREIRSSPWPELDSLHLIRIHGAVRRAIGEVVNPGDHVYVGSSIRSDLS